MICWQPGSSPATRCRTHIALPFKLVRRSCASACVRPSTISGVTLPVTLCGVTRHGQLPARSAGPVCLSLCACPAHVRTSDESVRVQDAVPPPLLPPASPTGAKHMRLAGCRLTGSQQGAMGPFLAAQPTTLQCQAHTVAAPLAQQCCDRAFTALCMCHMTNYMSAPTAGLSTCATPQQPSAAPARHWQTRGTQERPSTLATNH